MESRAVVRCMFFLALSAIKIIDGTVIVDTTAGTFVGSEHTVSVDGKQLQMKTFLGIPYAKPPIGTLRFQKPEPLDRLEEPFIAKKFGPACAQLKTPLFGAYEPQSEDCLFLNIYVPVQPADQETGHAVMVFIHGGGFEMGAGETYVGDKLGVMGNVIVVTINYRLGIFGFLSSGDGVIPGNMGLFDQHLALKWVNRNIAAFGGDAGRVTIFGESAGGSSVLFQGLFAENEGLIQRIISQSGVPSMAGSVNRHPKPQFDFVMKGFGCELETVEASIQCLKEMETQNILDNLSNMMKNTAEDPSNALFAHFLVSVDGIFIKKDSLPSEIGIKYKTEEITSVNYFRSLDVMAGYNSDDGTFLIAVQEFLPVEDPETYLPSKKEFTEHLINMQLGFNFGGDVPSVIKSLVISQYTDWKDPEAPSCIRDKYFELWTDVFFGKGTNEYVRMHANASDSGNTYLYIFSPIPTLRLIPTPTWVKGANHADELPFVFGFSADLTKDFNKPANLQVNDWELVLSKQMIRYWSNFAKTGDPNLPEKGNPEWPQFDMAEQKAMNLEKDTSDKSPIPFFFAEKHNFWTDTIPKVMDALKQVEESTSSYRRDKQADTCDSDKGCDDN